MQKAILNVTGLIFKKGSIAVMNMHVCLKDLPVVGAVSVPLELTETASPRRDQLIPSGFIQSVKVVFKN